MKSNVGISDTGKSKERRSPQVPKIQKCCCCLDLTHGTILTGVFTAVFSIVAITILSLVFQWLRQNQDKEKLAASLWHYRAIIYVGFTVYSIWIFTSVILLAAVRTGKYMLLLPWILYTVLVTLLTGCGVINMIIAVAQQGDLGEWMDNTGLAVGQFLAIFMFLLNIYALICVVSYFKELRLNQIQEERKSCRRSSVHKRQGEV